MMGKWKEGFFLSHLVKSGDRPSQAEIGAPWGHRGFRLYCFSSTLSHGLNYHGYLTSWWLELQPPQLSSRQEPEETGKVRKNHTVCCWALLWSLSWLTRKAPTYTIFVTVRFHGLTQLKEFFFFFKATRQIAIQIESGGLRYQGQWGLLFGDEHRSVCYGLGVAGKPMSGAEIWGWEKLTFWIRNERRVWNEMWQVPW